MKKTIKIIIAIVLIILLIWIIWSNVTVGVTHYEVKSSELPPSFDKYKIAVISDFHNAKFGKDNKMITDILAKEAPDIIAVTGDFVDPEKTGNSIELAKKMVEMAPCYYVPGNHESWLGDEYPAFADELRKIGIIVLDNKILTVENGDEIIYVSGMNDPEIITDNSNIERNELLSSLKDINSQGCYTILLSHRPELYDKYVLAGIDLVLSGHAHGGQFRIPFLGGVIAPNQGLFPKYDGGMYSSSDTTMIVSRGIGNSVIPVRINNRPEIVIVELNRR